MRITVLVYVLLYLVVELIGGQVAALRWELVTPLMVASAIADALLVVSVLVAGLLLADLARRRWRPAVHVWLRGHARPRTRRWGRHGHDADDHAEVIGVRSWRPGRAAPSLGSPTVAPTATYAAPTYAVNGGPARPGRAFPEDDGTLL